MIERALTLTQPWCGLVASGMKRIENRNRQMIRREDFGKPFALHAGARVDWPTYDRIFEIAPELGVGWSEHGPRESWPEWYRLSRITGAVIAVATVERAVTRWIGRGNEPRIIDIRGSGVDRVDLGDQDRWFFGPIGYVLRDIRVLREPVPCRGQQPFWYLGAELAAQVEQQLEAA